jgi:asparagine synthase (glutamine-hydrolysing)
MGGYSPRERFRERFRKYSHLPALRQIQAVDLETYLPGDILVKVDRATMAYSLESRAPWLDHRIVELAFGLPVHFNLNGRSGKYILKKAVEPYLPRDITTRSKMGFSVPLKLWFRTSLKPIFESLVLSPRMEEYVRLAEVRRVWEEHQSGMWDHTPKLWDLLMLAGWDAHHRQRVGILMAVLGSRQAAK